MTPFTFARATSPEDAARLAALEGHRLLGGGTNLVDLMRKGVEHPTTLVDVTALSTEIIETARGGLLIGAATRNTALAAHPLVRTRYPVLSRAILAGASAQIRNMATVAGNILQRSRCAYFNDPAASRCNKRAPGSGCDAREGFNRYHAIIGGSPACISAHPSDMCVALVALDAQVHLLGMTGARTVPLAEFYRLPGDTPQIETVMAPGEIITAIELPPLPVAARSDYRKVRDRASYAFALVSVAACASVQDGVLTELRLAFGGIAPKPWRALHAEQALLGGPVTREAVFAAMDLELAEAAPLAGNAFKLELARRTAVAVLADLTGVTA
ncbi:xanthine dehydrogenase family protein subunit M [Frigidibacter albus]|uniref:Xanthine dehydrogenase family protein subunit M n=1 Tax=Frigidibacter albus TaxID=1465486 RepID=A0A6L8VD74_9RHOB|nr:xanthine dehydrogenase family protein subunit M [Frigidibacter albus]MZQ87572.1 xanthine dehydrogenase family protein subunit M [Frigidibacter albus]NBE29478.1 xanthine dehydrogenase family protein subunit M [Frigidibacter albus]GGH44634.1 dehydrogenase [Frigidibacter albus]